MAFFRFFWLRDLSVENPNVSNFYLILLKAMGTLRFFLHFNGGVCDV